VTVGRPAKRCTTKFLGRSWLWATSVNSSGAGASTKVSVDCLSYTGAIRGDRRSSRSTMRTRQVHRRRRWRPNVQTKCRSSRLYLVPIESGKRIGGVTQQRNSSNCRYRFLQKLESLSRQIRTVESHSCDVSAGPRKTSYKSNAHGLAYCCHRDRNRRRGSLRGEGGSTDDRNDHIRSKLNQLCSQFIECLCLTFCKSIVEGDVLPFYVSQFMQSFNACRSWTASAPYCAWPTDPNSGNLWRAILLGCWACRSLRSIRPTTRW
jgi:hypothetical protein